MRVTVRILERWKEKSTLNMEFIFSTQATTMGYGSIISGDSHLVGDHQPQKTGDGKKR